jgi:TonB family protein
MLVAPAAVISQNKKPQYSFYSLDANRKRVDDPEKAAFLIRMQKISDTCWRRDTYHMYGPLIRVEYFKNHDTTILHGTCRYFSGTGKIDSTINFKNAQRNGYAYYFNESGKPIMEKKFSHNELVATTAFTSSEQIEKLGAGTGQENTFVVAEEESKFGGAGMTWKQYLAKNIRYPSIGIIKKLGGRVVVQFVVDKDGKIGFAEVIQSVEYFIDQEALRLLADSPPWLPARQNGVKVKSYKQQGITFQTR